jgi:hypothetical protein
VLVRSIITNIPPPYCPPRRVFSFSGIVTFSDGKSFRFTVMDWNETVILNPNHTVFMLYDSRGRLFPSDKRQQAFTDYLCAS